MKVFQHETRLRTAGGLTVTDITEDVRDAVRESGVTDGIACIYSPAVPSSMAMQCECPLPWSMSSGQMFSVRRRVSCWNTFIVAAILRESLPDREVEPTDPQWILQDD